MSRSSVAIAMVIFFRLTGSVLGENDFDNNLKPCTDYLSYACKVRNVTERPYIPKSSEEKRKHLKEFIESYPSKVEALSDVEKQFYKFRKYCTEVTREDKEEFLNKFNPSVGGWPAFDEKWKGDKFNLQAALAELNSYYFPIIFAIRLRNEPYSFLNQLHLKLSISDKLYDEDFKQFMKQKLSNIMQNVDDIISDGLVVESLYVAEKNSTDKDILTDFNGLKKEIPEINWERHFEVIYDRKIPGDYPIQIDQLGLLKRIIPKIFEVEPKVMANYILYRLGHILPDLDEDVSTELFQPVVYQMFIKQNYPGESKREMRSMFYSFLKGLDYTVRLFDDADSTKVETAINDFVTKDIMPDTDDSYVDNLYEKIKISQGECYFTALQLASTMTKFKSKSYFERRFDPLNHLIYELKVVIINYLPDFLDKSSSFKFEVLAWYPLESHFIRYRDRGSFKELQKCLENQIGQQLVDNYLTEALKFQTLIHGYFDWVNDNANLIQIEENKYNNNSKKVILERLIARYCDSESSEERNKISGIFANLKQVAEVYNCPIGSPFNPHSGCVIRTELLHGAV